MSEKNVIIIYVCHDDETINDVFEKHPTAHIIFVGDNEIDESFRSNPNIIVARDLPNNIEVEKKLLTFTAWYLIVKNDLFLEYEYICILENDVHLDSTFETNLINETREGQFDVFNFMFGYFSFQTDIDIDVLKDFLTNKGLLASEVVQKTMAKGWYPSTNHCIRRNVLTDFVDWYYPECLDIKEKHLKQLSWYHERVFSVYITVKEITRKKLPGLRHISKRSHEKTFNLR